MVGAAMSRVAVVTGGGGDIGGATGRRLAADGWTVVLADVDADAAARTAAELAAAGGRAQARRLDVSDVAALDPFVESVGAEHGRVDALVCAAGIEPPVDLAGLDAPAWDRTLDVNLRGPALLAKAALPWWRRQGGGVVVNVGSRTWLGGGHPAYAASKAGLVGLTRSLALELAGIGVRVNTVAPSFVHTRFSRQRGSDEAVAAYAEQVRQATPLRRLVTPDDVAAAIAFLASDAAAMITGEVLHVCGGTQLPLFVGQGAATAGGPSR
jgi:NAD(P)-dependent dehydrogenase (short-subunit alcohol dehydrogenase family)